MTDLAEKVVEHLQLLFFEDPSFKCARRIWLICHHFNLPVPDEVLDVFVKQLLSDDAIWQPPKSRGEKYFQLMEFIENHMACQQEKNGKARKSKAFDEYSQIISEREGADITSESLEKGLKRYKKWLSKK